MKFAAKVSVRSKHEEQRGGTDFWGVVARQLAAFVCVPSFLVAFMQSVMITAQAAVQKIWKSQVCDRPVVPCFDHKNILVVMF